MGSANNITINAGGLFFGDPTIGSTTSGTMVIGSITLNDNGGAAPNFEIGSGSSLFADANSVLISGNVTVLNNSLASTPTISVGAGSAPTVSNINLGGVNRTFNISGSAPVDLQLGVQIQNGSLIKTGTGDMVADLGPGNNVAAGTNAYTFTGVDIQQGTFEAGYNYALGGPSSTTTLDNNGSGAVGTLIVDNLTGVQAVLGTINFNGGILAVTEPVNQGNIETLANNIGVGFSATYSGNSVTTAASTNGGTILLYDVRDPTYAHPLTLSGPLSGTAPLNVVGTTLYSSQNTAYIPLLTLTGNSNTFSGQLNISSGATVSSAAAQGYGNTFGSNTVTFNNGALNIADSGTARSSSTLPGYNNSLVFNGPGTITLSASSGASVTGNTVPFNNLTLNNNSTFTASASNAYKYQVGGVLSGGGTLAGTAPVTLTGTVSPGGNVNTGTPAILQRHRYRLYD